MFAEWLKPVLFLLGYFALMRWVLPALGISTCLSGSCQVPRPNPPPTADVPVSAAGDNAGKVANDRDN